MQAAWTKNRITEYLTEGLVYIVVVPHLQWLIDSLASLKAIATDSSAPHPCFMISYQKFFSHFLTFPPRCPVFNMTNIGKMFLNDSSND